MENVIPRLAIPILALVCGVGLWLLVSDPIEPTSAALLESTENEPGSAAEAASSLAPVAARGTAATGSDGRSLVVAQPEMWASVDIVVADRNGTVEGAMVRPHAKFFARPLGAPEGEELRSEFLTGPDGRLALEVAPWTQNTITVTRPGLEWGQELTWRSPAQGKHKTVKIRLLLGTESVELQVLSAPGGAAVEGARVAVGSASTLTVPLTQGGTTTNANGVVRIPATPEGASDRYRISVSADNHASGSITQEEPDADGRQTLWLKRNATLRGSVAFSTIGGEDVLQAPTLVLVPKRLVQGRVHRESEPALVDDPLDAKDPTTDGPTYRQGDHHRTEARPDGTWSFSGIQFAEDVDEIKNQVLLVRHHGVTRVLARDIHLRPGDVIVLEDPWLGSPALDLAFTLENGEPAAHLGKVVLVREEAAASPGSGDDAFTSGVVGSDGTLRFSSLPKGRWRWEARSHGPLADVGGIIEHDGTPGAKTVELNGYSSVRGRIEQGATGGTTPSWFEGFTSRDPGRGQGQLKDKPERQMPDQLHALTRRKVHWRIVGESGALGTVLTDTEWRFFLPLVPVGRSIQLTHGNARGEAVHFEGKKSISIPVGTDPRTDVVLKLDPTASFNMTEDAWQMNR